MNEQALDDMALRVARTKHAAALFRAEIGRVCRNEIATPLECANAMMSTAVMTAFIAAAGHDATSDAVNDCIVAVTQVINRHVTRSRRK